MPKRKAEQQITQELHDDKEEDNDVEQPSGSDEDGSEEDEDEDGESSSDDDSLPSVSSETDNDSSDDGDDHGKDAAEDIIVDFEFFDLSEKDFHGLRALLTGYLDAAQFDSSGMVDAMIAQSEVGTVVKTSEEDSPIGVMTVLNTAKHGDKPFMQQTLAWLCGRCKDVADKLQAAWTSTATGLIVNERLMNSPPSIAPPLLQSLMDEIGWASEDLNTEEERDAFKFKRYLLVTRVYSDPLEPAAAGAANAAPRSKKKAKAAPTPPAGAPLLVYVRPEDEYLHRRAVWSHVFASEGRAVGKDELVPMRLLLLVEAAAVAQAQTELDAVLGNPMREQRAQ